MSAQLIWVFEESDTMCWWFSYMCFCLRCSSLD